MSDYNFTASTDTSNMLIQSIKQNLISSNIIDESNIAMHENLEITDVIHASVFLVVDLSLSTSPYFDIINRTVRSFVSAVVSKNSYASESVDFCYITFGEKVRVRRPLGYLSQKDIDASWIVLDKKEIGSLGSCTDIASALFTTWYMAEERKRYLKEIETPYKQPIIILISDLFHNVETPIQYHDKDISLLDIVLDLLTVKADPANNKLGIAEMVLTDEGEPDRVNKHEYAKKLYGLPATILDESSNFAALLNRFLAQLIATVADLGKTSMFRDDEDDKITREKWYIEDDGGTVRADSTQTVSQKSEDAIDSFFDRFIMSGD